jgi:hypothetical protein
MFVESQWISKIKYHSKRSFKKCNARLVTKGFSQVQGQDDHTMFILVVRFDSLHCWLYIITTNGLDHLQLDVKVAILYG